MVNLIAFGSGQGTGHCPAGIFKNIISNVTKNEEAGHGPVPCPSQAQTARNSATVNDTTATDSITTKEKELGEVRVTGMIRRNTEAPL